MVQEVMAVRIPQNGIMKTPTIPSSSMGDIVETYNLDLTKNMGSVMVSGNYRGTVPIDSATPSAFTYYSNEFYMVCGNYVYKGGNSPSDPFTRETGSNAPTDIDNNTADLELFNGDMYVSGTGGGDGIHKLSGSTWSVVSASGLSNSTQMHLMKSFANRLYISDGVNIVHLNTSDALSLTGTATFNPKIDSSIYVCTMLEASFDSLWIGYLNTADNTGIIFEWDGSTEDLGIRKLILESGPLAGTVKDNIPYVVDTRGRLRGYSGNSFVTVASLNNREDIIYQGVDSATETTERPIHPNGITTNDNGRILFLFNNALAPQSGGEPTTFDKNVNAGVYEYDENIGVYHKYSTAHSPNTTVTGYGDLRLVEAGGIFYRRPNTSPAENGALIYGARTYTDDLLANSEYAVYYDDNLDTKQKYGYFITSEIRSSNVADTWQKVYLKYKKLLNSADKIVVKYRTDVNSKTEFDAEWINTDKLMTNADLSNYSEGDEIQIIQGTGSGKSAHIKSITEHGGGYNITLDDDFTGATGGCVAVADKWIKCGEATYSDGARWKELPIPKDNVSPMIQFKVCMQFTGENELYGLHVVNKPIINE